MEINLYPNPKKAVLVRLTFESLHQLLGIPDNMEIVHIDTDTMKGIVNLKLNGNSLPLIPQGMSLPEYSLNKLKDYKES